MCLLDAVAVAVIVGAFEAFGFTVLGPWALQRRLERGGTVDDAALKFGRRLAERSAGSAVLDLGKSMVEALTAPPAAPEKPKRGRGK